MDIEWKGVKSVAEFDRDGTPIGCDGIAGVGWLDCFECTGDGACPAWEALK